MFYRLLRILSSTLLSANDIATFQDYYHLNALENKLGRGTHPKCRYEWPKLASLAQKKGTL